MEKINVGDVVKITRGTRYPPLKDEEVGIVIEELPTTGDWPVFIVMWNGHVHDLPARRLKKLAKTEHTCIKSPQNQLN